MHKANETIKIGENRKKFCTGKAVELFKNAVKHNQCFQLIGLVTLVPRRAATRGLKRARANGQTEMVSIIEKYLGRQT